MVEIVDGLGTLKMLVFVLAAYVRGKVQSPSGWENDAEVPSKVPRGGKRYFSHRKAFCSEPNRTP